MGVPFFPAFVGTHYRSNLNLNEVTREVELHSKYAMQLFRRNSGVTLWNYLTQHRIWHAQRLLVSTELPIADVAREAGFGSDSQLHLVFSRHCGLSPRQYRADLQKLSETV